jgi:hypothetical protein
MEDSHDNPLKPTKGDRALALGKAAVAGVPLVGGSIAELLGLVRSPLTKRLEAWCDQVNGALAQLREQREGLDPDSLASNDEFVSAVQHATQIAMRTHQQEKIDALRNAVLNVAAGTAPGDDLQLMFLGFVDAFTPLHLRILRFFRDPYAYYKRAHGADLSPFAFSHASPAGVLEKTFTKLGSNRPFCRQIVKDLETAGLLGSDRPHLRFSENWFDEDKSHAGALEKRTTDMGDKFLDFIARIQS